MKVLMNNKDIYESALRILAESAAPEDNEDYEERAPYLLAAFCTEAEDTDKALRASLGEKKEAEAFNAVFLPLEARFPLLPRFSAAASFYLAAMLIIDDNAELSDRLYDKYCDAISRIQSTVPALTETVTDRYFFR